MRVYRLEKKCVTCGNPRTRRQCNLCFHKGKGGKLSKVKPRLRKNI